VGSSTLNSMTKRVLILVGVIGLSGLGLVTLRPRPPSAESVELAAVIRGAQTAELNLETIPVGYQGPGTSAVVMEPVLDRAQTELARYYVGTLLAHKVAEYQSGTKRSPTPGAVGASAASRPSDSRTCGSPIRRRAFGPRLPSGSRPLSSGTSR